MLWHFDPDFVVPAIVGVIIGVVRDGILIAQLIADVLERLVQIIDVNGYERAATSFLGEILKDFVALGEVIFAVACLFHIDPRW